MYQRLKIFKEELDLIQDSLIKKFTEYMIAQLPEYFFEVAASSTGKYHSDTCCGNGGLVRHTKAAVMFAHSLWDEENSGLKCFDFSQNDKDCAVAALILHDGYKHGLSDKTGYTAFDHPLVAAEQIQEHGKIFAEKNGCSTENEQCFVNKIAVLVSSHMGRWNTAKYAKGVVLPEPVSSLSYFVHLCDYLASRSFLDFRFDKAGIANYQPKNYWVEVDLTEEKNALVQRCRDLVAAGIDRESIYSVIQTVAGVRNLMRIESKEVLDKVVKEVCKLEKS